MSSFKKLLFPVLDDKRISAVLLLLRGFSGLALMNHGWTKIQNPFHWMDNSTDPAPAVFQMLAAVAEFFGGMGLVVGALTVVASFGVFCTMVVAVSTHMNKGDPFGKWELAAFYACVMVFLAVAGPGRFSFDAWLRQRLGPSNQ